MNDNSSAIIQEVVTPENLVAGNITEIYHMQTREPLGKVFLILWIKLKFSNFKFFFLDCPACYNLNVFLGQSVENGGVPTYTIYREYNDEFNTLDVSYFTFYPYNRGKETCVGIKTNAVLEIYRMCNLHFYN